MRQFFCSLARVDLMLLNKWTMFFAIIRCSETYAIDYCQKGNDLHEITSIFLKYFNKISKCFFLATKQASLAYAGTSFLHLLKPKARWTEFESIKLTGKKGQIYMDYLKAFFIAITVSCFPNYTGKLVYYEIKTF